MALALAAPLNSPRLRDLAAGKRNVLLIVEDASRPAKTASLLDLLQREIGEAHPVPAVAGLIFAGGAHRGLEAMNIRHKLPPDITWPIMQHDASAPAAAYGSGSRGSPLRLNPILQEADFRIGLGTVNFHPAAGFSGGMKLIMPGLASLETIMANHALPPGRRGLQGSAWREEMEALAGSLPFHFYLAMLCDPRGELVGLWTGEPLACEGAARAALTRYALLPRPALAGFCLVDTAPFDRSLLGFFKGIDLLPALLSPGGIGVIACRCPEGKGEHLWRWHPETIRRTNERLAGLLPGGRLALLAPGVAEAEIRQLLPPQLEILRDWDAVRALAAKAQGPKYVVPYGPLTAFG